MATNILRLSEQGRRAYSNRQTCGRSSRPGMSRECRRQRFYVDGKELQKGRAFHDGAHSLRADPLY
jgi:hypothetical protein